MPRFKTLALPVLVAIAGMMILVVAGCARPTAAAQPVSSSTSSAASTNVVDLPPSYVFSPSHISVSAGSTVTWTNHDNFTHSVQVDGQSEVHMMKPGESAQITFSTPGDYHYVCTLHTQNMQGSVTVT